MKSIIYLLFIFFLNISFADEVEIENATLSVAGSDVDLQFKIKGGAQKQVKILFHGSTNGFTETSTIQSYFLWTTSSELGKTTVTEMLQDGWDLKQMFFINNSQAYLLFEK